MRGDFAESGTPWKAVAGDVTDCTGADDCEGEIAGNGEGRGLNAVGCDLYNLAVSGDVTVSLTANTGTSCTHSGPTVAIPYALKICDGNILDDQGEQQITVHSDGKAPTLQAETHGNVPMVTEPVRTSNQTEVCVQYIVRRLTPTECARLQGFPDAWGHPDNKEDFTDEEYRFWLNVRNTHAAINGKPQKDYTKAQMLTWYNKLHTDSSEYKMWGNGISLPTALYVMQGIQAALKGGEAG